MKNYFNNIGAGGGSLILMLVGLFPLIIHGPALSVNDDDLRGIIEKSKGWGLLLLAFSAFLCYLSLVVGKEHGVNKYMAVITVIIFVVLIVGYFLGALPFVAYF